MNRLHEPRFEVATNEIGPCLAELRARAMKPSLVALGRYDEQRVRARFLDGFSPADTLLVKQGDDLVGFFVLRVRDDHILLDHLYFKPEAQGQGLGGSVMQHVLSKSSDLGLPVRLVALKGSPANAFYQQFGFVRVGEDEFDNFLERSAR